MKGPPTDPKFLRVQSTNEMRTLGSVKEIRSIVYIDSMPYQDLYGPPSRVSA